MKVKHILAAATLALTTLTANATEVESVDFDEICEGIAGYSYGVMMARQRGTPIQEVINIAKENDLWHGLYKTIILESYGWSQKSTEKSQRGVSSEFSTAIYFACIKATEDK